MEFIDANLNTLTDILLPFYHGSHHTYRRFTCIAVTFVLYAIGFQLLTKFAKAHMIHEAVPKINQHRLKIGLWHILFALWAIVLYSASVWDLSKGNFLNVIFQASTAPQCNSIPLNATKQNVNSELALFTAPVAFFMHEIYLSISSFTEPAVTSMGGLSLFVYLCHSFQCHNFCLQVLFLLGLNLGTLEVARTIYALRSRIKGFNGAPAPTFLQCIALPAFVFHLLVWMLINFYLFPKMYFSLPSATEVKPPLQTPFVYINLFVLFYAKKQFFDSPAWSLVKLVVKKPSELGRACALKSLPMLVLLPYSSSLLPELKTIQMQFLMNALPTSAERRIIRKKILSGESQTSAPVSEGKADLLSVIKCVKILKRKMRRRYEEKTANEASSENQNSQGENDSIEEDLDEAPQSPDVTDVFIPVPSLPKKEARGKSHEGSTTGLETTADVHVSSTSDETEAAIRQRRLPETEPEEESQD